MIQKECGNNTYLMESFRLIFFSLLDTLKPEDKNSDTFSFFMLTLGKETKNHKGQLQSSSSILESLGIYVNLAETCIAGPKNCSQFSKGQP